MTKAVQKITLSPSRDIPFNKLVLSQSNVRRVKVGISIEQRLEGAAKVGHHKTSMLQDIEAGRPLELEAIVGVMVELGDKMGLALPCTRTVYACVKLLTETTKGQM